MTASGSREKEGKDSWARMSFSQFVCVAVLEKVSE